MGVQRDVEIYFHPSRNGMHGKPDLSEIVEPKGRRRPIVASILDHAFVAHHFVNAWSFMFTDFSELDWHDNYDV